MDNNAANPIIFRCHRLIEAFSKSDDERDFYLDRKEGFLVFVDLDKTEEELEALEKELHSNKDRYIMIPKLTFYETKKLMDSFVNEKVYDIDTKEKLNDIISSKEAKDNFLDFLYDQHMEFEKWQQFYQERFRIRVIEWLRNYHFTFVFEEDLDLPPHVIEKIKTSFLEEKPNRDILQQRKLLVSKAKTYYSSEALNPRPKRGRPPKQAVKQEVEQKFSRDLYMTVPATLRPFLFMPESSASAGLMFSSKFQERSHAAKRTETIAVPELSLDDFSQKIASLRALSKKWMPESEEPEDEEDLEEGEAKPKSKKKLPKKKL